MKHAIYIPTNRNAENAVTQYTGEARHLSEALGSRVPLLLIEATDSTVAGHRSLCGELTITTDVEIYHVTRSGFARFLESVLTRTDLGLDVRALVRQLMSREGISYGLGPNKAAVVGAALGVDVLHRRDSDTVPHIDETGTFYPSDLEIRAIGRQLPELGIPVGSWDPNAKVLVVASAYTGDPPVDRRDLLEAGMDLAIRLERLADPGASDADLEDSIRDYYYDEPGRPYSSDYLEVDTTGKTEMGVAATFAVWRQLPEMPMSDTIGSDYMQKNLMYRFKVPVLFHSRKVLHAYDGERRQRDAVALISYALRDLRYLLLWRVWSAHNRSLQSDPQRYWTAPHRLDQAAYATSFRAAAKSTDREELETLIEEYVSIYQTASERTTSGRHKVAAAIAQAAGAQKSSLIDHVMHSIEEYCQLVEAWPAIISSAGTLGPRAIDFARAR